MNRSRWPIGLVTGLISGTLVLVGGQVGFVLACLAMLASAFAFARRKDLGGLAALAFGWGLSWSVILGRVLLGVWSDPSLQTGSNTYVAFISGALSAAVGLAILVGAQWRSLSK